MKPFIKMCGIAALVPAVLLSSAAQARNASVERALERRSDLSLFYQGLINTGVINELQDGVAYTIIAPTNDAMAQISEDRYPCFYSVQCRAEVADILRNHIVVGEANLGRQNALFSIDQRHIPVGKTANGDFTLDGQNVLSAYQMAGGMLLRVDGVIADSNELATMWYPPVAPLASNVTRQTVTERVYYSPDGRPDGYSQTTTYTLGAAY